MFSVFENIVTNTDSILSHGSVWGAVNGDSLKWLRISRDKYLCKQVILMHGTWD